jgi:hypothetical protein
MEVPAMTDETKTLPVLERQAVDFLRQDVATLVLRLRALADKIEHDAKHDIDRAEQGNGAYGTAAGIVAHSLAWGLANASIGGLIRTAADADIAHAKGD